MKFFLTPQRNDFLDDFGTVFACSIAITIDHGQIACWKFEAEFCGFFSHDGSLKEKPAHSIEKTTAAISNSKGESLAWTGHFDIAVGGGKLGGLLEAKNAIKAPRLGLERPKRYALYLELAAIWRVLVPVGDCVLFASKRSAECGLRLEVFDCFIFSHADSIAYSIGVCRFDLTICSNNGDVWKLSAQE